MSSSYFTIVRMFNDTPTQKVQPVPESGAQIFSRTTFDFHILITKNNKIKDLMFYNSFISSLTVMNTKVKMNGKSQN